MSTKLITLAFLIFCHFATGQSYLQQIEVNKLGGAINSESNEKAPVISPDGKELYFLRTNHSQNIGLDNLDDIWLSYLQSDGSWSRAINVGAPLNNRHENAVVGVAPSGDILYLINSYDKNNPGGLAVATRKNRSWSQPQALEIDHFPFSSSKIGFHLSASSQTLILSIDQDDSFGDQDIYVSFQTGKGQWGAPQNLGPIVNTSGSEVDAFLAADGKTLYFASNRKEGFGGFDLFMTKRLDESWKNWSKPVNLGSSICTPNDDRYFSIAASGKDAFFVRSDQTGETNIYHATLPVELQPEPVVFFSGRILDAQNQKQVIANLSYRGMKQVDQNKTLSLNPDGSYSLILPYGENMELLAEQEGYFALGQQIELSKQYEEGIDIDPNNMIVSTLTNTSYIQRNEEIETINLRLRKLSGELKTIKKERDNYLSNLKEKQNSELHEDNSSFLSDPELDALRHRYDNYNVQKEEVDTIIKPKLEELTAKNIPSEYALTSYRESEELEDMKRRFNNHYKLSEKEKELAAEEEEKSFLWEDALGAEDFNNNAKKVRKELKEDLLPVVTQELQKELIEEVTRDLKKSMAGINLDKINVQEVDLYEQVIDHSASSEFTAKGIDLSARASEEPAWEKQIREDLREVMVDDIKEEMKSDLRADIKKALQYEVTYQAGKEEENELLRILDTKIIEQIKEEEETGIESMPRREGTAVSTVKEVAPVFQEMEKDILLIPIEEGSIIPLERVFFNPNSTILKPTSTAELQQVVDFLKKKPQVKVEIGGHTNGWTSHSFASKLSTQRAEEVKAYLIKEGIDPMRLSVKGYGKSQPIASKRYLGGA